MDRHTDDAKTIPPTSSGDNRPVISYFRLNGLVYVNDLIVLVYTCSSFLNKILILDPQKA